MLRFRSTRRRVLSPEEQAANAAKRSKRAAAAMTCQCCGRRILANTGFIAHHGYERPDFGWQTASCYGARRLPFEAARAALGELIDNMKARRESIGAAIETTTAETSPVRYSFNNYDVPPAAGGKRPAVTVEITRATFAQIRDTYPKTFQMTSANTFAAVKAKVLATLDRSHTNLGIAITEQEKRFNAWVLTHTWNRETETWEPAVN